MQEDQASRQGQGEARAVRRQAPLQQEGSQGGDRNPEIQADSERQRARLTSGEGRTLRGWRDRPSQPCEHHRKHGRGEAQGKAQ